MGGQAIRRLRVAAIQKATHHDACFAPPLVRIDKELGVARRLEKNLGRACRVAGALAGLGAREDQAWIVAQRGGNGIHQTVGIPRAPAHRGPRLLKRDIVRPGAFGRAHRAGIIVGIIESVGTSLVVVAAQHSGECGEGFSLDRGVQIVFPPGALHEVERADAIV